MRPHVKVSGGKSGGGNDRSHLEEGVPQGLSQCCIERTDIPGNRQRTDQNNHKIPANLFDGKGFLKLLTEQAEIYGVIDTA